MIDVLHWLILLCILDSEVAWESVYFIDSLQISQRSIIRIPVELEKRVRSPHFEQGY
jgi:hypothetical protein